MKTPIDLKQKQFEQLYNNEILIHETEIKSAAPNQPIFYPNVNTSTTLSLLLDTGETIGVHFSAISDPTTCQQVTTALIQKLKMQIGSRKVKKLFLIGARSKNWQHARDFFPNATKITPFINCNPAMALGVFFYVESAYSQITDQVNIKIRDGNVFLIDVHFGTEVSINPNVVISADTIGVDKCLEYIEF